MLHSSFQACAGRDNDAAGQAFLSFWKAAQNRGPMCPLPRKQPVCLAAAARRHGKQVVSVGVDTWALDFVLLSKSSEMLGLPHHYRDRRTLGMMNEAFSRVPR